MPGRRLRAQSPLIFGVCAIICGLLVALLRSADFSRPSGSLLRLFDSEPAIRVLLQRIEPGSRLELTTPVTMEGAQGAFLDADEETLLVVTEEHASGDDVLLLLPIKITASGDSGLQLMPIVAAPRSRAVATAASTYGVRPLAAMPTTTSFARRSSASRSRRAASASSSAPSTDRVTAAAPPAITPITWPGSV